MPFRVADRRQDTADTWTIELEPVGGGFAVAPGQFVMVWAFGVGEVPISVSGPPEQPGEPVVLTVRDVGAVTHKICAAEPGAVLGLRGPLGNSWPVEAAEGGDVVVVAGGIGLAPLRPVVLHTLARRAQFGAVSVLYGARTPLDLLYTDELVALERRARGGGDRRRRGHVLDGTRRRRAEAARAGRVPARGRRAPSCAAPR